MKYKQFGSRYFIKIEKGEEVVDTLKSFCKDNKITLGTITGLGATNKVVLGLFKTENKEYVSKEYTGDHEITSFNGNVSQKDGEVYLHIHASISDEMGKVEGGHLSSAVISATFECILDSTEGTVERYFDEEIGLNLWKL